jgi:hypothetical protein
LLFVAAAPAARSLRFERERTLRLAVPLFVTAVVLGVFGIARGPLSTGAGRPLLDQALREAAGMPILADAVPSEQIAAAGGRVWISNPLDAFNHHDQRLYLDWLAGRPRGDLALDKTRVVLAIRGDDPAKRLRHSEAFRPAGHDANAIIFVRRGRR